MKLLIKTALILFAAFLAYRSYDLMKQLLEISPDHHGHLEKFILAFLLCLFITGVFALPGFAIPTSRVLRRSFYTPRSSGFISFCYRMLGVEYFRKVLMFFYWGRSRNRKRYFDGTRAGLENLRYQSEQSEFGHLAALICISLACIPLLYLGHEELVLYTSLINIIGNLYPVILQRHHLLRLSRLSAKNPVREVTES